MAELAAARCAGDRTATHRQLGGWFAARGQQSDDRAFDSLAVEHFLAAGDANSAWTPARRVVLGQRHAGRYREALAWVERVLHGAPTGPTRGLALALQVQLGMMAEAPPAAA